MEPKLIEAKPISTWTKTLQAHVYHKCDRGCPQQITPGDFYIREVYEATYLKNGRRLKKLLVMRRHLEDCMNNLGGSSIKKELVQAPETGLCRLLVTKLILVTKVVVLPNGAVETIKVPQVVTMYEPLPPTIEKPF